jgi:hypothetical protein
MSTDWWRTVHVLDTNPLVTKSLYGGSRAKATGEGPGDGLDGVVSGVGVDDPVAAGTGVTMTAMQMRIVGRRLPGSSWSGRKGIHVGIQRDAEVVSLVNGDEGEAVFDIDLDVVEDAGGEPDLRGAYIHGRRGERFVYLTWGEVDESGTFTMFRRLKLHLTPLLEQHSTEKLLNAKRIQAVLELSDTRGRPLGASVRPPWVTWRLLNR